MAAGLENTAGRSNRITTATTTQVTTTPAILDGLLIPTALAGIVTIYDAVTDTNTIVALPAAYPAGPTPVGILFTAGIRVKTASADEVVVIYRNV